MIIALDIFSQVKGQSLLAYSSFGRQSSFQIAPETFQAINLLPFAVTVLCRMLFYQAMNPAFSGNACVTLPRIGTDATPNFYPSRDQG